LKNPASEDRRKKPRIYESFAVTVEGVDSSGESFEEKTVLMNLSAGGIYFCLSKTMRPGTKIKAFIEAANAKGSSVRLAARGVVLRIEPWLDGTTGFAARLTRYRSF